MCHASARSHHGAELDFIVLILSSRVVILKQLRMMGARAMRKVIIQGGEENSFHTVYLWRGGEGGEGRGGDWEWERGGRGRASRGVGDLHDQRDKCPPSTVEGGPS
jgi:hypothetical protein